MSGHPGILAPTPVKKFNRNHDQDQLEIDLIDSSSPIREVSVSLEKTPPLILEAEHEVRGRQIVKEREWGRPNDPIHESELEGDYEEIYYHDEAPTPSPQNITYTPESTSGAYTATTATTMVLNMEDLETAFHGRPDIVTAIKTATGMDGYFQIGL